ncbi:hypothetical protein SprV_0301155700 [Sparganum proliferum]
MHKVFWSTTVKIYPVQLANLRVTFDEHVKTHLNKYIADLNGLLLKVDKSSLRLVPPADLAGVYCCSKDGRTCLTRLPPELPCVLVRAEALATVFRPTIGLRLEATVSLSKRHFLTCRYDCGDGPISITVPKPSDGKEEFIDEGGAKVLVYPQDKVALEVVQIIHAAGGLIIRGKLLKILERGSALTGGKRKKFTDDEETAATEVGTVKSPKKRRKKKQILLLDDQLPEGTPVDEEAESRTSLRKTEEVFSELPSVLTAEKKRNKKKDKLLSGSMDRQQQREQREKEEEEPDTLQNIPVKVEPTTETTHPNILTNPHRRQCHRTAAGVALKAPQDDCTDEGHRSGAEDLHSHPEALTVKPEPGVANAAEHRPSWHDRSPDIISDSGDSNLENTKSEGW